MAGSRDTAMRVRAVRRGRETGCWVYIAGEQLNEAGYTKADPPPFYRVTTHRRSKNAATATVSLYREP